jgi:hypothetical protein
MGDAVDIAAWLRELGLERYEPVFRANEIDAEVLPRLTAGHLTALGVTAAGTGANSSTPSPRSARETFHYHPVQRSWRRIQPSLSFLKASAGVHGALDMRFAPPEDDGMASRWKTRRRP